MDPTSRAPSGFGLDVWCDHQEEISVLRAELAAIEKPDNRRTAALWYELGRIHLAAGNQPAATEALLRSYTLRPHFRPTLRLARLLYRERSDFKLVVKLLDAESRATQDPFTRTSLLRQQARLLWTHLGDTTAPLELLETANRIDATDLSTLKLLQLFYSIKRDPVGLRSVLLHQLESVSDQALHTALKVGLALLLAHSDPRAAIDDLIAIGEKDPGNLFILSYLEQVVEAHGYDEMLAENIVRQATQLGAQPSWRAKLLARAARIHRDRTSNFKETSRLFFQSLEAQPLFGSVADYFDFLLDQGQFAEAVKIGETLFGLDDSPSFLASLACQIADVYRIELDDKQSAAIWYTRCLKWSSSYQPALEELSWLLDETDDLDRLLQIHRADLAHIQNPPARAQCFYRIATLLERHGRETEALDAHRQALATWPAF